jgi:alpha-tubulin suppressor-like RCC1 family protein
VVILNRTNHGFRLFVKMSDARSLFKCYLQWFCSANGALAMDDHAPKKKPTCPPFFKDKSITSVRLVNCHTWLISCFDYICFALASCGGFHTLFLTENNDVYASGQNTYGELFQAEVGPVKVLKQPLELFKEQNVTNICAGSYFVLPRV